MRKANVAARPLVGLIGAIALTTLSPPAAHALTVVLPAIEMVMTGSSSSGSDQVWLRVVGQPNGVPSDCVYGSWSLFYVDGTNGISAEKVLSILLTAKTASRPVHIEYGLAAAPSDFYGFGISKCHIMRIALI